MTTHPTTKRSRRLSGSMALALSASLAFAAPALALDDIRDRMDDVEQQQDQAERDRASVDG
ncbi:MAG: hypothetical protein WA903_04875, partial [Ornithinimicrobium sp.]